MLFRSAATRGVPMGEDCVSPSRHSAFSTPIELMQFIAQLRELSGGKPVGFKFCLGHPWEFMGIAKAMLETGILPDFIVVDGKEGGTGAAPLEFTDHIGVPLREGLLSAEDDNFANHYGVDVKSLMRAAAQLLKSGHIQTGGSTITMQVAKNYFLTNERSFSRKINEILLALQIERQLTKDEILELYVNKIYLGNRAYGIEAAAQVYYGKPIKDLSLAEMAMIAGLPKAPSRYNPLVNPTRSTERRNWILERMLKLGFIDQQRYQAAVEEPINASYHVQTPELNAP